MRIVVAEDSLLFREGLVRLLGDLGHEVVATVEDADSLAIEVDRHLPDLAIVDVRMPPDHATSGAQAAAGLRESHPETGVVLLSQHIELSPCRNLLGTPGFGYLLKDRVLRLDEFDDALRRVAEGGSALDPEIVQALVRPRLQPSGVHTLTEREEQVLALVAEGQSNAAISTELRLSDRTVESHMRSIFTKLGLPDDGSTHRRVRAVVTYLDTRATGS